MGGGSGAQGRASGLFKGGGVRDCVSYGMIGIRAYYWWNRYGAITVHALIWGLGKVRVRFPV